MEIIDRPLSEIIKEQKIGESLRRGRRGGGRGRQQNSRAGRNSAAGGEVNRRRPRRRAPDGTRNRLRLRRAAGSREIGRSGAVWNRRRRYAMDIIEARRDRSVKSGGSQRRGITAFERNDRIRAARRREALSRIRSRFSRD